MYVDFQYTRNLESDSPIMVLDKHIGGWVEDLGYGINGEDFAREIMALDDMGKKSINIWINSTGGSVIQGMSIYNAILNTKTKVNTFNTGVCASIAAVIFQAGRVRSMADYSLLMIHNTSGGDSADMISKFNNSVATMISSRCGKSIEDVLGLMDKTTWYSASECLLNGLCDEVTNSSAVNKKRISAANDVVDNWKVGVEITNSALNTNTVKTNTNMSNLAAVANSLGLNSEASGEAIAKEIQKLKNVADIAKSKEAELTSEIEAITNKLAETKRSFQAKEDETIGNHAEAIKAKDDEIAKIQNDFKAKVEKLERLEKEKEEALEAAKINECRNMVEGFAKVGRIENKVETVDEWVELAAEMGVEKVKNMIEKLPLNKAAAAIPVTNHAPDVATTSAAMLAAQGRLKRQGKL